MNCGCFIIISAGCVWFRDGTSACGTLSTHLPPRRIYRAASGAPSTSSTCPWRHRRLSASRHHADGDVASRYVIGQRRQRCHGSVDSSSAATDDVTSLVVDDDAEVAAASEPREWARVALPQTAPLHLQTVLQRQTRASLLTDLPTIPHLLLVIGQSQ